MILLNLAMIDNLLPNFKVILLPVYEFSDRLTYTCMQRNKSAF
jgi:hypothetical protein